MQLSSRLFFLSPVFGIFSCGMSPEYQDSYLEGYPSKTTAHVADSYIVESAILDQGDLRDYIHLSNKKIDRPTSTRLAGGITSVARCFAIDPRLLAAQIQQESNFDTDAESPTKAVGLMQMTSIGIQEVEDQLGRRGASFAGTKAIIYFQGVIATCASQAFGADFLFRMKIWERADTMSGKKFLIRSEPEVGLAYGAILLKTLLSKARVENTERSIREIYERALWLYNGDPEEQQHYQTVIMQRSNDIK